MSLITCHCFAFLEMFPKGSKDRSFWITDTWKTGEEEEGVGKERYTWLNLLL